MFILLLGAFMFGRLSSYLPFILSKRTLTSRDIAHLLGIPEKEVTKAIEDLSSSLLPTEHDFKFILITDERRLLADSFYSFGRLSALRLLGNFLQDIYLDLSEDDSGILFLYENLYDNSSLGFSLTVEDAEIYYLKVELFVMGIVQGVFSLADASLQLEESLIHSGLCKDPSFPFGEELPHDRDALLYLVEKECLLRSQESEKFVSFYNSSYRDILLQDTFSSIKDVKLTAFNRTVSEYGVSPFYAFSRLPSPLRLELAPFLESVFSKTTF